MKCFWKCSYWLQGKQQISPTNWGRKRERLRNGSREGDGWRIDSCQLSKKLNQKKEGGMAGLLRSLLVLMLESASSQGVVMDRKNSYESLTLEMLFFHRGEVDCRVTESWVLGHREKLYQVCFPSISREMTLVVRSNDKVMETICLMVKNKITGSIWCCNFLSLTRSDFVLRK